MASGLLVPIHPGQPFYFFFAKSVGTHFFTLAETTRLCRLLTGVFLPLALPWGPDPFVIAILLKRADEDFK